MDQAKIKKARKLIYRCFIGVLYGKQESKHCIKELEEEYEKKEKSLYNYTVTNNKIVLVSSFNGKIGNDENGITNGDTSITTNGITNMPNVKKNGQESIPKIVMKNQL